MNCVISACCSKMVVRNNQRGTTCGPKSLDRSVSVRGSVFSDLTDAERALIEPHMPAVKRLGRPRETDLRAVLDGILYIARTVC